MYTSQPVTSPMVTYSTCRFVTNTLLMSPAAPTTPPSDVTVQHPYRVISALPNGPDVDIRLNFYSWEINNCLGPIDRFM